MYSNNQQSVIFCQKELKKDVKPCMIQDKESVQNVEDWCLRCPMQEGYLQRNVHAGIVSNLPNFTTFENEKETSHWQCVLATGKLDNNL